MRTLAGTFRAKVAFQDWMQANLRHPKRIGRKLSGHDAEDVKQSAKNKTNAIHSVTLNDSI